MSVAATLSNQGHQHPGYDTTERPMRVVESGLICPEVKHLVLEAADGGPLVGFQPGSHLILHAGGHRNAYSLTGNGLIPSRYTVSILKREGDGGSAWIHKNLSPGTEIVVEGPRSMFPPVHNQRHALLVAGGIGITPILSHTAALAESGSSGEIIYAYKPERPAHVEELRKLCATAGFRFIEVSSAAQCREVMAARFADQPLGSHAYACGPISMLDAFLESGRATGWPDYRLHVERFEAPGLEPGHDFSLIVADTGRALTVPSGTSVLQTLEGAGYAVPNMCRQGVCGECRISVTRTQSLEHRDFVLTEEEKAAGDSMMSCVSRGEDVEVIL